MNRVESLAASSGGPARMRSDFRLVGRQLLYEQVAFWRNPVGAAFTVGFSVVFLILLGAGGGNSRIHYLHNIRMIQYYVPGFAAYGVMAACFNTLAIVVVVRRELGLMKRLRLSPAPRWVVLGAIVLNALVVAAIQVVLLFLIGHFAYHVALPHGSAIAALVLALVVGAFCFTGLGIAMSTVIPNQDSAGPVTGIVFFVLLFLSGLWFPLKAGSALAKFSTWFPIRHLILATFAPFETAYGVSPWSWHDLLVMVVWGAAGIYVAVRRFRWEPRRA